MNLRHWMERRAGGIVLGLCALLATGGCGNTKEIRHGREFINNGASLRVSSLGPACGCVSLQNTAGRRIMLESTFFGIPRGGIFLDKDERTRILFDWGGPENEDFYQVDAYVALDGDEKGDKLSMVTAVNEYAPFIDTACGDSTCTFSGLAMNRMMDDHEELERENPTRGIEFTSVITVAAPQNECGCMMLTNYSDHDLTIRATRHGTQTGQLDLLAGTTTSVTFDWAGALETDVYVIDAIDVRVPGDTAPDRASAKAATTTDSPASRAQSAMTIRLKDYVKIDGTLVNMTCQPEFVEFVSRRQAAKASTVPLRCPWIPDNQTGLGMRVAYDKRTQQGRTDAAAAPALNQSAAKPRQ